MQKVSIIVVVCAVLLTVCCLFWPERLQVVPEGKPTLKIGVTLPLSGEMAYLGEPVRQAIEMALADMKTQKKLKYDYVLIFEDDQMDSKQILLNYHRLKEAHKVNAMMSMGERAVPISQLTSRDRIIHMTCGWGGELGKGYYNFNHSTFPEEQVEALIQEFQQRGVKRVGMVQSIFPAAISIKTALESRLKDVGIALVFDYRFRHDQTDYRKEIEKMKAQDVDIVYINLLPPSVDVFLQQASELGYRPEYTGLDTIGRVPQLFEGVRYVADGAGNMDFQKQFVQKTGYQPTFCVANLYDGLKMLVYAYESTPTPEKTLPDNKMVVQTLLNMTDFDSVTGDIYIDKEGNIHTQPHLAVIQNGKSVLIEEGASLGYCQ